MSDIKIISHRGNINGRSEFENDPRYLAIALSLGFDVEVDVWNINGLYFLGHDDPKYPVKESFLEDDRFWCHAKNLKALDKMLNNSKIHCFWHEDDQRTITSDRFVWTYPHEEVCEKSVIVHLDDQWKNKYDCYGICTDHCF